jgi:hypothetical protein
MGRIVISLAGSFGAAREFEVSAMEEGHAAAVGKAIRYLAEQELPEAIRLDHLAARDGEEPSAGFASMGKKR